MSVSLTYTESLSGIVDASGNCTLRFNGPPTLTRRTLSNVVISCSNTTLRSVCRLYRAAVDAGHLMATSQIGYADTFVRDPADNPIESGEPLYVIWSGAPVGSRCTANPNGQDNRA